MEFTADQYYLFEIAKIYVFKDRKSFVDYLTETKTKPDKSMDATAKSKFKVTEKTTIDYADTGSPIYNSSFRPNSYCILNVETSTIDIIISELK